MATTARKTTTPPPRRVSTTSAPPPASNTTNIGDSAEVVEKTEGDKVNLKAEVPKSDEVVTAIVPKAFTLTLDDHTEVHIAAGTQELPHSHATHWFARAQGVKVYEPKA